MKLIWEDIEAHRNEVTVLQWRRMRAYFLEGKSLTEIGGAGCKGHAKTSVNLSIGRGTMAILKAMLGTPEVRTTNTHSAVTSSQRRQPPEQLIDQDLPQPLDTRAIASSSAMSQDSVELGATTVASELPLDAEGPQGSHFRPFAGLADLLRTRSESMPRPTTPQVAAPDDQSANSLTSTQSNIEFAPHMRVEGTHRGGHDMGEVEKIAGTVAVVVWDSGFKTLVPLTQLTPLTP